MREFKIRLGKVLVAFSVVLLLISFSFQLETGKSNTIEIANLNSENDPNIYVTTVDGSAPDPVKETEETTEKPGKDKDTKDVTNENPTGSGGNKSSRPSSSSEENTPSKTATTLNSLSFVYIIPVLGIYIFS